VATIVACLAVVTVFSRCGKDDKEPPEPPKDPLTYDEGVVINGVKWATRNVDKPGTFANFPEASGMLYQWGRNIAWSSSDPLVSSNGDTIWNTTAYEGNVWTDENCPCPKGWRMPTSEELKKLIELDGEWTTTNGVLGRKFESGNNILFLPATGRRTYQDGGNLINNNDGVYWSGDVDNDILVLRSDTIWLVTNKPPRTLGNPVRCVAK